MVKILVHRHAVTFVVIVSLLFGMAVPFRTAHAALPPDPNAYPVAVNETNFPDFTWREYVKLHFANGDELSYAEAALVTTIDVSEQALSIKSLQGIEYFYNVAVLDCAGVGLLPGGLDISRNLELTDLDCSNNALNSLAISDNQKLVNLDCSFNALTSLDASDHPALVKLFCSLNPGLAVLDVSGNPVLEQLFCGEGSLAVLDVSDNPLLKSLVCRGNSLTVIDVSHNPLLEELSCEENLLSVLDVSDNPLLEDLYCTYNKFFEPIVGLIPGQLRPYDFSAQEITVMLAHDGQGGYVSVGQYPRADEVTLSDPSVTFVDGRFYMPSLVPITYYSSYSGYTEEETGIRALIFGMATFLAPVPHTVTFLDWDDAVISTQTVESGNAAEAPDTPIREGYTFSGWDTDFSEVVSDLVVNATYAKDADPIPLPQPPAPSPGSDLTGTLAGTGDALFWAAPAFLGALALLAGVVALRRWCRSR